MMFQELMSKDEKFIDKVIHWLFENLGLFCVLGAALSASMVTQGKWAEGTYTNTSFAFIGIFGVFITFIMLSQLKKKLVQMKTADKKEFELEINKLHKEEMKSTTKISRKIEICDEKKSMYEIHDTLQNRDMGKFVISGLIFLILLLVLQPFAMLFPVSAKFFVALFFQGLFWIGVYNLFHAIILLYDAYCE